MSSPLEMAPVIFPKPPSRESDEASGRSIRIMESLRRHRALIGVMLLMFLALSGFVLYRRRNPIYEAQSRIYISPASPKALTDDKQQIGPYDNFLAEQLNTVTRYDVLEAALKKLPRNAWAYCGPTEARAIAYLQKSLKVERIGESFEAEMSLEGPDPHTVTDLVNTISETYVEKARHEEFFERDQRLAILHDEENHLQTQLAEKEQQEQQLFRDLGVGSVDAKESSPYNDQIAKLHVDLQEATEQLNLAQSTYGALQAGGSNSNAMQAAAQDVASADPGLVALKSSLATQRGVLVQQMAGLTPSNPVYKQDEEQLKSIDAQIAKNSADLQKKAVEHITHKDESDIYQKRLVVAGLERQLMQQTRQATGSAPKFAQAQQLSADIENLRKSFADVEERMRELEVDSSAPGSVHLLTAAMVPLGPKKNKTVILAFILLVMSVGASAGAAIAIDYLDPHIYGADDVKQVMGFAPLGLLLDHDHFSAEVSQQYLLRLAAAVHHAVRASGARTFLFTATEPESGTTTLVDKVARQLRSLNMRTLTIAATDVDGRITYVSTSPTAEAPARPVSAAAAAAAEKSDKLERHQPGPTALSVHVGEPANNMFSGSFVAQILSEHQDDYDAVLIDGGPLLISADSEYLARIADGTVVVTQSGRTTRSQLKRSATLLEKLHVPGVAVVLNRVQPDRADAALRQDIEDFQQQLKKQRGTTALSKHYTRRIPQTHVPPVHDRPVSQPVEATATRLDEEQGFKAASAS